MILAGDIGGTKTILALFDWKHERVESVRERTFASADFKSLEEVIAEFLKPPAKSELRPTRRSRLPNPRKNRPPSKPPVSASRARSSRTAARPRISPGSWMERPWPHTSRSDKSGS
jgi:hypothetical protein